MPSQIYILTHLLRMSYRDERSVVPQVIKVDQTIVSTRDALPFILFFFHFTDALNKREGTLHIKSGPFRIEGIMIKYPGYPNFYLFPGMQFGFRSCWKIYLEI